MAASQTWPPPDPSDRLRNTDPRMNQGMWRIHLQHISGRTVRKRCPEFRADL